MACVDYIDTAQDRDRWHALWTRWWTVGYLKTRGIYWL